MSKNAVSNMLIHLRNKGRFNKVHEKKSEETIQH